MNIFFQVCDVSLNVYFENNLKINYKIDNV